LIGRVIAQHRASWEKKGSSASLIKCGQESDRRHALTRTSGDLGVMVMLSKLRHFKLLDVHARQSRLDDLSIALLDSDYPPITHLFFRNAKRELMMLPGEAVKGFDWRHQRINVEDLTAGKPASPETLTKEVLLRRDVIDALLLDLQNRHATRANDLWLEEKDGQLMLTAADTSARAVIRRLSRGFFGSTPRRALIDWKYIEFLRGDPSAVKNGAGYRMRIRRLPPGEIAGLCSALPYLHAAELLTLLPDPVAADTLEVMTPDRQLQVFGVLDEEQALKLITLMAPDAATDLLGWLPAETTKRYLEKLPASKSQRLIDLLRYPEDTVGGIMTSDVVCLPMNHTVAEARAALHDRLKEPDFTHFIYIVENDERRVLRGVSSLRDILMADDEKRLAEIMNTYISTLNPLDSAKRGAYRVLETHMAALPVVGREKQILGIVTVDAAVAQAAPQGWRTQAPKVFS
jgi:magnesium transporter